MEEKPSSQTKALYRRYLLWAYKSTRESFERIERKTTQLVIDHAIKNTLAKAEVPLKDEGLKHYQALVDGFDQYIAAKHADEIKQKFVTSAKEELNPEYLYLRNRLAAIEAAIEKFLGPKALAKFNKMFEEEFTRRILEARDH